jgi:predicted outer membrane lipoprotein
MENEVVLEMLQEISKIFVHIVIPGLAGITFFALAKFVKHIAPLRALVSSYQTYQAAFWSFLIFGFYLALRPVQVLAGPHPWPLIISCLREFLLLAGFGPIAFLGLMTLCLGDQKVTRGWIIAVLSVGVLMGAAFCVLNAMAIGGSEKIVRLGMMTAYDGLWFKSGLPGIERLMHLLFLLRILNPGLLLLAAGLTVIFHARHYPAAKRSYYDNMPKKLYILGAAACTFSISLIFGSFIYGVQRVPDQWGFYHLGALIAGVLETISLSMPVKNEVQVSEHL